MAAETRRTETEEKGGEWRPVPLVVPGETWAWTLPGHTDLSWTDSGHYYCVNWAIYMTDWQTLPPGVQANGCNCFLYSQIWLLSFYCEQKKQKARIWIILLVVYSRPARGEESVFLCFLGWLCLSCLGISWDYKQEVAQTSYPCYTHPSALPPSPKQMDQSSEKQSVEDIYLYSLKSTGCRWLIS